VNPIRISPSGCIGYAAQTHPGAHEGDHQVGVDRLLAPT
jgi:hypothetical protein